MKNLLVLFAVILLQACVTQDTLNGKSRKSHSGSSDNIQGLSSDADTYETDCATAEQFVTQVGDRVFFAFDNNGLSQEAREQLDKQVEWLQKNEEHLIEIQGHCDQRGTKEYNMALGERRAEIVKRYLVSNGISEGRIMVASHGKERLFTDQETEEGYAQNRRVVLVLIK
jgi:peptidoglycan-associated lipoprotein